MSASELRSQITLYTDSKVLYKIFLRFSMIEMYVYNAKLRQCCSKYLSIKREIKTNR